MYWFTESPIVEGKVKVNTGPGVIRLSHPGRKQVGNVNAPAHKIYLT